MNRKNRAEDIIYVAAAAAILAGLLAGVLILPHGFFQKTPDSASVNRSPSSPVASAGHGTLVLPGLRS